jgi:hypothetical protein
MAKNCACDIGYSFGTEVKGRRSRVVAMDHARWRTRFEAMGNASSSADASGRGASEDVQRN